MAQRHFGLPMGKASGLPSMQWGQWWGRKDTGNQEVPREQQGPTSGSSYGQGRSNGRSTKRQRVEIPGQHQQNDLFRKPSVGKGNPVGMNKARMVPFLCQKASFPGEVPVLVSLGVDEGSRESDSGTSGELMSFALGGRTDDRPSNRVLLFGQELREGAKEPRSKDEKVGVEANSVEANSVELELRLGVKSSRKRKAIDEEPKRLLKEEAEQKQQVSRQTSPTIQGRQLFEMAGSAALPWLPSLLQTSPPQSKPPKGPPVESQTQIMEAFKRSYFQYQQFQYLSQLNAPKGLDTPQEQEGPPPRIRGGFAVPMDRMGSEKLRSVKEEVMRNDKATGNDRVFGNDDHKGICHRLTDNNTSRKRLRHTDASEQLVPETFDLNQPPRSKSLNSVQQVFRFPVDQLAESAGLAPEPRDLGASNALEEWWEELAPYVVNPDDVFLGREVAGGSFGRLFRGTFKGETVAIKVLPAKTPNEDWSEQQERELQFLREVAVLAAVQHPNVVQLKGACRLPEGTPAVVMEYLPGGTLSSYIRLKPKNGSPLWRPPARQYNMFPQGGFGNLPNMTHPLVMASAPARAHLAVQEVVAKGREVAQGMAHVHGKGFVHRDLKPGNLMLAADGSVKIIDFGLARRELDASRDQMTAETGTYRWMAPEVLCGKRYDHKADVYSFSLILWEMVTGTVPFHDMTQIQAAMAVLMQKARPSIPDEACPPSLGRLIEECWDPEPDERPSFEQILGALEGVSVESQVLEQNAKSRKLLPPVVTRRASRDSGQDDGRGNVKQLGWVIPSANEVALSPQREGPGQGANRWWFVQVMRNGPIP